jgi:lipopolysaccharide export system protein LptC
MTGMRVQSFDNGGLQWALSAPVGEMYTRKNLMRVSSMTVTLFQNGQKSSEISAGEGLMGTGKPSSLAAPATGYLAPGDMYVNENVVVTSTDGSKMTTDWATYSKRTDLITSTAPVQIKRSDSVTKGVGLEASSDLTKVRIFNETLVIPEKTE